MMQILSSQNFYDILLMTKIIPIFNVTKKIIAIISRHCPLKPHCQIRVWYTFWVRMLNCVHWINLFYFISLCRYVQPKLLKTSTIMLCSRDPKARKEAHCADFSQGGSSKKACVLGGSKDWYCTKWRHLAPREAFHRIA